MIRVALETNPLYVTKAGVARYLRGLMKGFEEARVPDVEITPIAWDVDSFDYRQPHRALKTFYREFIWSKIVAPRLLRQQHFQILHGSPVVRTPSDVKKIITMHDLAVFRHPERFRRWQRYSSQRRWRNPGRVDRVICISRFTADEAINLLGLSAEKITVIHNGCDFISGPAPTEHQPDFAVPPEFFLFVGSLEPGKNLALLKQVYQLAKDRKLTLPPLLIVGARWLGVENEGVPPADWHYLGRQPDEVLVYLYRRAIGLVFPTKYEGFGLPLVEAMALSCPVICSLVASLPEIGGDAALFTEMTPAAYLSAMTRLSGNASLRDELISKGRARASLYSWVKCARQVLEVYRSAGGVS